MASLSKTIKKPLQVVSSTIGSSYTSDYQYRIGERAIPSKPPVKPYHYENLISKSSTYNDSFKEFQKESYVVDHVKKQYSPPSDLKFEGESGYHADFKALPTKNDASSLMRLIKDNQTHKLKNTHLEYKDSLYKNDFVQFGLENGDKSRQERRKLIEKLSCYKKSSNGEKFTGTTVYSEYKYVPGEKAQSLKPIERPLIAEKLDGHSSYKDSYKMYDKSLYTINHVKAKYNMMPITSLSGQSSYVSDYVPKSITVGNDARVMKNLIKDKQTHKLQLNHLEFNDSVYGSDFKDIGLENGNTTRVERKKITAKLSSFRQTVGSQTFQPMLVKS